MEIPTHLFLSGTAPSALCLRAEAGHTISVNIYAGIPQQIQYLIKGYGVDLLQIIHLPVQDRVVLHADSHCCHMSAVRQFFHHLFLQRTGLHSVQCLCCFPAIFRTDRIFPIRSLPCLVHIRLRQHLILIVQADSCHACHLAEFILQMLQTSGIDQFSK